MSDDSTLERLFEMGESLCARRTAVLSIAAPQTRSSSRALALHQVLLIVVLVILFTRGGFGYRRGGRL